ncbi:MAG: peptidoglycan-binding protein [Desulfobacula sp.]|uniref:CsgG/HfaB family protein n=1 Tax=Desulfobacula sp. TaxID=2593537 RepID=UPI0025C2BAD3|nr:CsgG/HfaB family protein [Desulfobacula sp.]MCD4719331.1 peptidoglycan-binding protein [Desulfobacula sp.]
MKRNTLAFSIFVLCILSLFLTGCMSSMSTGSRDAKTVATGSAGGSNAQDANAGLERCDASLGTMAIFEDRSESWYRHLTSDLRLPSTIPVIRLLAQQSNCFVVVERGRAMKQMMEERELMESGEMRSGSNFGKGQMVAADYTVTPSITFSAKDTGGAGGVVGGLFGSVAGTLAGGFKSSDASTVLTMIENRSGVQLAAAEGSARNTDYSLLGGVFGSGAGGAAGAYGKTPEGKVIVAAFTDSMNNLIKAVKSYKAQTVKGGLGTGGQLGVQGSQTAASNAALEGVMTERKFNQTTSLYEYVVVVKDKSRSFYFSSPRKIPYKNDLIQFSLAGDKVDENSIKLIERKYLQKYWQ